MACDGRFTAAHGQMYRLQMKSKNRFQPSMSPNSRARATAWLRVAAPIFR
jgi:hypothetical protein